MSGVPDGKEILDIALWVKNHLDCTIEEYELACRFPDEYDSQVNGIKHITVRDADQEYRYVMIDGELISKGVF